MTTNQTNQTTDDPYDSASTATVRPQEYFGQAQVDTWYCVLIKGTGKVPFDPGQHRVEDRRTAVDIFIDVLPEQNLRFPLERKMVAESREWAGTVWASLKALGMKSLRELNQVWVRVALVPNGSYVAAGGETKQKTTLQFKALYKSEDECRAAYLAGSGAKAATHTEQPTSQQAEAPASNGVNKEREVALKFLPAIVGKHITDLESLAKALATAPIVSKYFTVESPEVLALIEQHMTKATA